MHTWPHLTNYFTKCNEWVWDPILFFFSLSLRLRGSDPGKWFSTKIQTFLWEVVLFPRPVSVELGRLHVWLSLHNVSSQATFINHKDDIIFAIPSANSISILPLAHSVGSTLDYTNPVKATIRFCLDCQKDLLLPSPLNPLLAPLNPFFTHSQSDHCQHKLDDTLLCLKFPSEITIVL